MIAPRHATVPVVALAVITGCFSAPVPEDALITCVEETDCPEGFGCALEVQLCIPSEVLAAPGPALEGEPRIAPALVRAGDEVVVTFQADQRLGEPPVVTLEGTDFTFGLVSDESDTAAARFVYRASIAAGAPDEGTHTVVATVKSAAGRPAVLRLGTLAVDRTANRVDGALAVDAVLGAGGSATLSFAVVEPVDDDHLPRVFFVDEDLTESEAWELESGDGAAFTFRYTVPDPPTLDEGVHEVRVVLLDNAGNASVPLPAGTVTLDARAPELVEATVGIAPSDSGGAALLGGPVAAAGPGAVVTVTFTASEELREAPSVALRCPGSDAVALSRAPNDTSSRFFRYLLEVVNDVTPEGACALDANVIDLAGNEAVLSLPEVVVDQTPPAPLVDESGAGATLARAPWGVTDLDGDGELDIGTRVLLDAPDEPGLVAVAFEAASGSVLARGPAGAPLDLGALDRAEVEVAAVDAAGNLSPVTPVRRGLWVATLGGKVADSTVENPHRAVVHRALPRSLDEVGGVEVGGALAGVDGVTAQAQTTLRWRAGPDGGAKDLPRYLPAVAWDDARGVAVAFGGVDGYDETQGLPTDSTWEWDGTTWRRVPFTVRPPPRYGAAMAYDRRRGVMVLFGGTDAAGNLLDDTWELDGVWRQRAVAGPTPRSLTQAAYDPLRGEVVLFGGADEDGALLADTWTYDGESWTEHDVTGPGPRARAGMTFDEVRGVVVLFGGQRENASFSPWLWDGSSWSERPLGAAPYYDNNPYHEHRLAFDAAREQVVMVVMNIAMPSELEVLAMGDDGWEPLPTADGFARAGGVWFADPGRRELVFAAGGSSITQVLAYGAKGFARADAVVGVRSRLGATFDPITGGPLLIAGVAANVRPDTWTYDGNRFRLVHATSHGAAHQVEAFTYAGQAYTFGGIATGGYTNQLRRFDGAQWSNVGVSGTPPTVRGEGPLVYDEAANVVVLFGGGGPGGPFGDTYTLSGTTWTKLTLSPSPSARFGHTLAYDRVREGVVLYGGDVDDLSHTTPFADTWLFKDGAWEDISDEVGVGPGPRTHHQMATDPLTGRPLLFGGLKEAGAQDNVLWELGEGGWQALDAVDPPPPTYRGVLVDDPTRHHVILFGGMGRDEAYTLDRAFGEHPAIAFHVDVTHLGLTEVEVTEVEIVAVAGGAGSHPELGSMAGASLELFSAGRWTPVADNDAPLGALGPVSSGSLPPYEALFGGDRVHAALAARAENGAEVATVAVDHVEVRVRYVR